MLFLSTLQEPYYDRLMPTAMGSFTNMVKGSNLIGHAIKNDRIDIGESSSKPKKGNFSKKKEGETQALYKQNQPNQSQGYTLYQNNSNYQLYYSTSSNQTSIVVPHYTSPNNKTQAVQTRLSVPNTQPSSSRTNYPSNNQSDNPQPPRTARPLVEPISVSYTELLPKLILGQLLARVPLTSMEPPYLCWYDANVSSDYHYGIKGHSTKNCLALKNKVQALKNTSYVSFNYDKAGGPNVINNPLLNHSGPRINVFWKVLRKEERAASGML